METILEHKEIDGVSFILLPIIPFEDWFINRFGTMTKFHQLNQKDKEKIFLRWKWGFMDDRINEVLESSEITTLVLFKDNDLNELSIPIRFYIENKRYFAAICQETREKIGLGRIKYNPLVEKVIETFDAQEA